MQSNLCVIFLTGSCVAAMTYTAARSSAPIAVWDNQQTSWPPTSRSSQAFLSKGPAIRLEDALRLTDHFVGLNRFPKATHPFRVARILVLRQRKQLGFPTRSLNNALQCMKTRKREPYRLLGML